MFHLMSCACSAQGVTALWAVLPLSVQLLGSGGLEVSSTVVASLSLLFSKAAILQRQSALLLQPSPASRLEDLLLELLQVLVKRVSLSVLRRFLLQLVVTLSCFIL